MINLLGKLFKNKKHKEALTTKSIDNNNNKSRVTPVAENSRLKYQPVVEQEVILLAQDKDEIKKVPATIDVARLQQEVMNIQEFQKPIEDDQISNEPYEPTLELGYYRYPSLDLLELHPSEKLIRDPKELELISTQIRSTLKSYNIDVLKISVQIGPTVTIYEIVPATGVRVSKIKNLEREIALNLAVDTIKVVALLPGNGAVGIEISSYKKVIVSLKSLLSSEVFQYNDYSLPIALGKRMDGNNFVIDITSLPHLLIAGSTGQGKSVCIDAILLSLLYKKHPSQLKFVLIDPRKIDLSIYKTIELHFLAKLAYQQDPVASDTRTVMHTLNALCIEMDNRYDLLKEAGVRNIKEYNEKFTRSLQILRKVISIYLLLL